MHVRVITGAVWILRIGSGFGKLERGPPMELESSGVRRARSRFPGPTSRGSGEARGARSLPYDLPTQFTAVQVLVTPCPIWTLGFGSEIVKRGAWDPPNYPLWIPRGRCIDLWARHREIARRLGARRARSRSFDLSAQIVAVDVSVIPFQI